MEQIKIKFKNGKVKIKGKVTEKHLEDAIRELRKKQIELAEDKNSTSSQLNAVQKWQRMNRRAKEELCRMVVGTLEAV